MKFAELTRVARPESRQSDGTEYLIGFWRARFELDGLLSSQLTYYFSAALLVLVLMSLSFTSHSSLLE